mmetsp:Transcript_93533/g.195004  ORF Transcript_93533/g.195004 Transcript_93533/m.195004 type:complete len:97 (+) Transcript_93533:585-875(+)
MDAAREYFKEAKNRGPKWEQEACSEGHGHRNYVCQPKREKANRKDEHSDPEDDAPVRRIARYPPGLISVISQQSTEPRRSPLGCDICLAEEFYSEK